MPIDLDLPIILDGPDADDGDPFGLRGNKSSGLFDDVIITAVPHLAIISHEDMVRVLGLRPAPGKNKRKGTKRASHPLIGKWKCPHCEHGHSLHLNPKQGWMRCAGTILKGKQICNALPIDLAAAENLMFRALETFAPGREGNFAALARQRYDEVIKGSQADREQSRIRADALRAELREITKALRDPKNNQRVRDQLHADSDEIDVELSQLDTVLQATRSLPDEPDPETSLLELGNMISMLKSNPPSGLGVNPDALQFRNRLSDIIVGVTMVPKVEENVYDVEFQLNVSAALDQEGKTIEIVRFADQNLDAGRYQRRRSMRDLDSRWANGDFAISDRAWKKRPALPLAERTFGENLRWMVDTMIMTAETTLGTRTIVKVAGADASHHAVQWYRASEECELLRQWLQEVRSRKHQYERIRPQPRSPTLRERLEENGHPLLDLDRCGPAAEPSPLTDGEFATLFELTKKVKPHFCARVMRKNVDQTLEMLRVDKHVQWSGSHGYYDWLKAQEKYGRLLVIVNFLLTLEGKPSRTSLPPIPKGVRRAKPDRSSRGV